MASNEIQDRRGSGWEALEVAFRLVEIFAQCTKSIGIFLAYFCFLNIIFFRGKRKHFDGCSTLDPKNPRALRQICGRPELAIFFDGGHDGVATPLEEKSRE